VLLRPPLLYLTKLGQKEKRKKHGSEEHNAQRPLPRAGRFRPVRPAGRAGADIFLFTNPSQVLYLSIDMAADSFNDGGDLSMKLATVLAVLMLCAFIACLATEGVAQTQEKAANPMLLVKTSMGSFKIELYPKEAPITVKNILDYVDKKFYDGTIFHRVIPGFVIQGGGFDKDLMKKANLPPIKNEATNGLKNFKATLSMARTSDINSATSQFFINLKDNAALDHVSDAQYGYAVFGKVVQGFEVIEKIAAVKTTTKGQYSNVPEKPVIIESVMRVGPEKAPEKPAPANK
jgi:peptidyl-prolyl cis-trans isomerase A (cyclophilin A)